MRFGLFLAKRKIVSAADLLEAMAEQSRRRAFLPLFLAQERLMSADTALETALASGRDGEELLAEFYRRGLLSAREYQRVEMAWRSSAPRLGEILQEMGRLTRRQLESLLTEFAAEESNYPSEGAMAV